MPGPVPGIHAFTFQALNKTWMAGTSPAMTILVSQGAQIDPAIVKPRHQFQRSLALRLAPAAVLRVQYELLRHVLLAQRLARTAAQMRLALLDHAAVFHGGPDMTGIAVRIGIIRIDHELHLGREREHAWVTDGAVRERAEPNAAMHKAGRKQIGYGEFRGIAVRRALLVRKRLPQAMHRALRDFANDLRNVLCLDAPSTQAPR